MDSSFKNNRWDYLLSLTAFSQSFLVIVQLFLIHTLIVEEQVAGKFRVFATAIPILLSLVVVYCRNKRLMFASYSIVLFVILYTVAFYPGRWNVMHSDILKFTLPVVIPTGLCIASVHNYAVMLKSLFVVSILTAIVSIAFFICYFLGIIVFSDYLMAFSYGILFPCVVLWTKEYWAYRVVAVILMVEMLAIGSRGALFTAGVYIFVFYVWQHGFSYKLLAALSSLLALIALFFDKVLIILNILFSTAGIQSRTLMMMMNDNLVSHDSGRDEIHIEIMNLIYENPFFGAGIFADRQLLGRYSHGIQYELVLNFGYVGAFLLFLLFCIKQKNIFFKLNEYNKLIYLMMFISVMLPLLVSSSYLIDYNFSLFLGFSYSISRLNGQKRYL